MEKYRKAIFIVVYASSKKGDIEYLLLRRKLHWRGWEFPKGGIEGNESLKKTIERELKEETGFEIKGKIKSFDIKGKYEYPKKYPDREGIIGQTYSLHAVNVGKEKKVSIDKKEHSGYKWFSFDKAIKKLTWQNQKECLKIVNDWLNEKKFRKIKSKNGTDLIAGKDQESNEELVNQAKENESLLHTSSPGSPFVNIKGIQKKEEIIKKDIKEAAIFCARYSREWKKNKKDIIVHHFKKKDVYKTPIMKRGTFGVRNFERILVKKKDIENFN